MSTASTPFYFRRRTIGRAASPPTWACYEQIPYDEDDCSDSASDSCSEDGEDYGRGAARDLNSDSEDGDRDGGARDGHEDAHDVDNMDIDEEGDGNSAAQKKTEVQKDKGKQRAVDPEPAPIRRRQRGRQRQQVFTLRPILTIQKSQGFVWNQDLFVPPYIKDRYVASTSPPHSMGFVSTSASSTNSALNDYEIEVVEIRVKEGELNDIIP
ncbi:hypothetical protein HGRIS_000979 [Hohenbuehelia grisea]|uniref:Uncharacterized protein n=1 Tax=Hohenbuehelia grisea TaxID=104357 RepID=A0ABR3IQA4_9AGAR